MGVVCFRRFRRRGHIGGGVDRAHCAQMLLGEGCRITRNKEEAMWPLALAAAQEKSIVLLSRPDQSPSRSCHVNDRWVKVHVLIEFLCAMMPLIPLASTRCPDRRRKSAPLSSTQVLAALGPQSASQYLPASPEDSSVCQVPPCCPIPHSMHRWEWHLLRLCPLAHL